MWAFRKHDADVREATADDIPINYTSDWSNLPRLEYEQENLNNVSEWLA